MADPTTPEEFKEWLNKQAELLDKGIITQQEYDDAVKDSTVQMRGYAAQLRASQEQMKKDFLALGGSMLKGEEGASVYNKSMNSTADAISSFLSKIPYVGKLLGTLVSAGAKYAAAVNEQADALFKNYKELSRNGLATGMQDTFENLQDMGYTAAEVGKMGALMKENANVLANYGGTAAQGAKMFAKASKDIQYSDIGNQFKLMGMSVDDINKGMAGYAKIQQMSGVLQRQNSEQLAQSAADYMMKQDKLTKLTGLSAEQQNSIVEQAMAEQRYAATQAELRRKGDTASMAIAERNDELLKRFTAEAGPKAAKMFQDYASGMMNSEDSQKFKRTYGSAAAMIDSGVTNTDAIMKAGREDALKTSRSTSTLARAGMANDIYGDVAETAKMAGNALNENMKNADAAADKQQSAQKAGTDKGTKNMVDITTAQRNQTMVADKLTNMGIVPVTKGMAALSETLENATDIVGQLAGRDKRVGGGSTTAGSVMSSVNQKIGGWLGGGGGSAAAPAGGGGNLSVGGDQSKVKVGNEVREGGNINWRNNNPGNIRAGAFATSMGAIGENGGFAVFPTMEMGRRAADTLLKGEAYSKLSAADALKKWAPSADNNDPVKYAADLSKKTGIDMTRKYADLSPDEQAKFLDAMTKIEGGKAGTVTASTGATTPKAATGGILTGPKSGFQATLHGTEAVVPLPDGRTIPVQMKGGNGGGSFEQIQLLTAELDKLDSLVRIMQKQNDVSAKILQRHS